jgi:alginate O-acetyltransferase complex protein AlgI
MLFSSFTYLTMFLPVVALAYAAFRRFGGATAGQACLLLASIVFYTFSGTRNLVLLLASIAFNWLVVRSMAASAVDRTRRLWLILGLTANVALLLAFKYLNFFAQALPVLGLPAVALPDWTFPLGISFFTLTQVMYLVDCYQGIATPVSLFRHATFVSFFPYITSGPLVRAESVMPQLQAPAAGEDRVLMACQGVFIIALGLAKKIVLADSFAQVADAGFSATAALSTAEAWIFSLAYSLQLYFDFSGYSDMALGSALLFGIRIPQNFNAPYLAASISEFWQRWHISLSQFITNYLYTPILRSMGRATLWTSALATVIAMGIAGLWHGPALTFVVFGLMHGIALALNQRWRKYKRKLPWVMAWLTTLVFVNAAFVVFRSPDLASAMHMLGQLLPHSHPGGTTTLTGVLPISLSLVVQPVLYGAILAFVPWTSAQLTERFRPTLLTSVLTCVLLLLSALYMNSSVAKSFVYFAF